MDKKMQAPMIKVPLGIQKPIEPKEKKVLPPVPEANWSNKLASLPPQQQQQGLMQVDYSNPALYRDLVILYCPQKVGSTSVVTSIRLSQSEKFFVMHTHDETIFKSDVRENDINFKDMVRNTTMRNPITGLPRRVFVIDIYRTPVERKISEFFHEMGEFHFNNTEENIAGYDMQKIIKRFNDVYPHVSNEDYFKERFDSDFNYEEFDFKKKYIVVERGGVHYIKLRLKDSKEWGSILSGILGTEITAVYDYETRDKKIGELYKRFMETYRLPFNYFKTMEACEQLKCYYNFEERYEYLHGWWAKTTGLYPTPFTAPQYKFYKDIYLENQFHFRKLFNHYKDDGCLCVNCVPKRKKMLATILAKGDKHLEWNLHNMPENAGVKSENAVLVRVFGDPKMPEKYIILSLMM